MLLPKGQWDVFPSPLGIQGSPEIRPKLGTERGIGRFHPHWGFRGLLRGGKTMVEEVTIKFPSPLGIQESPENPALWPEFPNVEFPSPLGIQGSPEN